MRRKGTIGVLLVLVCAGFVVSALYGQPRPVPARPPQLPQPGQVQPPENQERLDDQRTRVIVEVYQVDGPSGDLARIDLDKIAGGSISDVLARLAEAGKARLMHRVDTPTEFGQSMAVTDGNRVPVVQEFSEQKGGPIAKNVNYQETGLRLSLTGLWSKSEENYIWAHVDCGLDWSSLAESEITSTGGVKLPAFGQFKFDQRLQLRSGEPIMFLASHQPLMGSEEGRSTLGLVRLTVIHLEK